MMTRENFDDLSKMGEAIYIANNLPLTLPTPGGGI